MPSLCETSEDDLSDSSVLIAISDGKPSDLIGVELLSLMVGTKMRKDVSPDRMYMALLGSLKTKQKRLCNNQLPDIDCHSLPRRYTCPAIVEISLSLRSFSLPPFIPRVSLTFSFALGQVRTAFYNKW